MHRKLALIKGKEYATRVTKSSASVDAEQELVKGGS